MIKGLSDGLSPKGKVEIFVSRGKPTLLVGKPVSFAHGKFLYDDCQIIFAKDQLISEEVLYNIIVNEGKDSVINSLFSGGLNPIGRMVIGDRGTIPSDPTVPKVPQSTFTSLYNEVYRADCDTHTIDVGTPDKHEIKFIKTFNAIDVPLSSFSNQANPVINEVGLVTYDPAAAPFPRAAVAAPAAPLSDEKLFSIRTFKSVPFEAANEIAVTIRYTIFIQ
jgi:hypothetical protein